MSDQVSSVGYMHTAAGVWDAPDHSYEIGGLACIITAASTMVACSNIIFNLPLVLLLDLVTSCRPPFLPALRVLVF